MAIVQLCFVVQGQWKNDCSFNAENNYVYNTRIYSEWLDQKINPEMVCGLGDTNWIRGQRPGSYFLYCLTYCKS